MRKTGYEEVYSPVTRFHICLPHALEGHGEREINRPVP